MSSTQRAAIFARKSTEDREGLPNIAHQLDSARTWAKEHGYEVVREIVEEDISGALSYLERPGISEMLSQAQDGEFEAVIFTEVDRFARSQKESARILLDASDIGLDIITVETGGALRPFDGFDGVIDFIRGAGAQDERRRTKRRMVRGRIKKMKDGGWPGGPTPYGYALDEDKTLIVDESEAETVRMIFELALRPDLGSVLSVVQTLNDPDSEHHRVNRKLNPFTKTHVAAVLADEIYVGDGRAITMGGTNSKGEDLGVPEETVTIPAPSIIDRETFDTVQRALARRRKRYTVPDPEYHLYALSRRIVHIHPDGEVWGMGGEYPKGRRNERLYRCQASREKDVGCPGCSPPETPAYRRRTSVNASRVESYVIELGIRMIETPEVIEEMVDEAARTRLAIEATATTREGIQEKLESLDEERSRALDQNRKGWLTDSETERALNDIEQRREHLEGELAELDTKVETSDLVNDLARVLVNPDYVPDWASDWEPVQAGTIGPEDERWDRVMAGLKDEVEGRAPDQEPDELSEWARGWARHVVETLDLAVVVDSDGAIYATTEDPRIEGQPTKELSTDPG